MAEPYAETPLAAYTDVLARSSAPGQVHITEVPFKAQINLRVDPKSPAAERMGTALGAMLPNQPGDVVVTAGLNMLWLGPDEWLLIGSEGAGEDIQSTVTSALAEETGAVTDVSANRTIIEITGPKAAELLNKGCALDLHPRSLEANRCAQTLLARAGVILVCRDAVRAHYWLIVRSSFARYVADWLADAATEYQDPGGGR